MQAYLFRTLLPLVTLLFISGCTLPPSIDVTPAATEPPATAEEATPTEVPPAENGNALENSEWQLISFGPSGAELPVIEGSMLTLTLAGDGQAGGQGGCNRFGGSYQLQGDTIVFGELISTLMACVDAQVTQQEQAYLQALQSAGRYEVTADALTIWYADESSQLNFVPLSAAVATPAAEEPSDETAEQGGEITLAERVTFEPGEISATRSGTLAAGMVKEYALAASAGQTMHIQTVGYNAPVSFTVYGPGGESWTGEPQPSGVYIFTALIPLPTNGDYLVQLSVPDDATETQYDVTFTIDDSIAQPMTPQPGPVERVQFAAGTTSAERSGLLPTGPGIQQYLLSASGDQTMTVEATSDGTPLSMTIESPSGNQWIPEMQESADGYTIGHEFILPEPGYYVVSLAKADHTPSTNYTITFTIE